MAAIDIKQPSAEALARRHRRRGKRVSREFPLQDSSRYAILVMKLADDTSLDAILGALENSPKVTKAVGFVDYTVPAAVEGETPRLQLQARAHYVQNQPELPEETPPADPEV